MDDEDFRQSLRTAVDSNEPWFVIAASVLDPFRELTLERRRSEAASVSLASSNMLSRYLSVLGRLREISERHNIPVERLVTPVFSATEIAVRIYERDPESGLVALEKLKERRTTLVKLRQQLADIERRRSVDKIARGRHIDACERGLAQYIEKEFPAGASLVRRPALAPFSKVGWLILGKEGRPLGAVDFFEEEGEMLEARLAPAVLLSTFFKRFFVVFHGDDGARYAANASGTLDFFGARSFGTLLLNTEGSIETIRPAIGGPTPDRSEDYPALEAKFAFGRGPRLSGVDARTGAR